MSSSGKLNGKQGPVVVDKDKAYSIPRRTPSPTLWGCEGLWAYDYGHGMT